MAGDLSDIKADVPQFAEGDFGDNDVQFYLSDFFDHEQIDDSVDLFLVVLPIGIGYGRLLVESYGPSSGKSSSRSWNSLSGSGTERDGRAR